MQTLDQPCHIELNVIAKIICHNVIGADGSYPEIRIVEHERVGGPFAVKSTANKMATAECMGPTSKEPRFRCV